jgi:hypothetical protein
MRRILLQSRTEEVGTNQRLLNSLQKRLQNLEELLSRASLKRQPQMHGGCLEYKNRLDIMIVGLGVGNTAGYPAIELLVAEPLCPL